MMDNWGGYGTTYGNTWVGLLSFVFMGLFIAALVLGVIFMLRHTAYPAHHGEDAQADTAQTTALDILNQRYAKGDITKEEYRTMKKDITEL